MQNIIVLLIGVIVFGYVGWKIYKSITRKPDQSDKCGGCTGCALKVDVNCKTK
jgi:hypothetical protein